MRILITGSSGYLGQHLLHYLTQSGSSNTIYAAYGSLSTFPSDCALLQESTKSKLELIDQTTFNLSDAESVKSFIANHTFDAIIHLAAISSLYACEKNPANAMATNCPSCLLEALTTRNTTMPNHVTKFIFLSTDQVYDGFDAPYKEADETGPINLYGKSKLAFETKLLACDKTKILPIILRSSLILGGITPLGSCRKQSFLQFVQERLSSQTETGFFYNEYRNVVYVGDIVQIIHYFIHNKLNDVDDTSFIPVFNMGGKQRVARDKIADEVASVTGLDSVYIKRAARPPPLPLDATPNGDEVIVRNPPDISMNMNKLEKVTGITMKGLQEMVKLSFQA